MTDPELYQREFDDLMRATEYPEKLAALLHGVDKIEELFAVAAQVGITTTRP
jgi:hypothetical protein